MKGGQLLHRSWHKAMIGRALIFLKYVLPFQYLLVSMAVTKQKFQIIHLFLSI